MLISFLGSRGSGKTTVADLVSEKLQADGLTVLRQHEGLKRKPLFKSLFISVYLWRFFDAEMIRSFGFMGRGKRFFPSLYRLYLPLALAHDLHQVKTGKYDVLIYDSNILRGMIAMAEKGEIEPEQVADLYERKVLSEVGDVLLVVIDLDPQEAIKRWIARDEIELAEKDKQEEIEKRIQEQKAADVILNSLITLENVKILRLSGGNTPDANALLVTNEVQKNS